MHFYAWKKGLKTGMYYLRTKPAVNAIQYTVDKSTATTSLQQQQQLENNLGKYVSLSSQCHYVSITRQSN